MKNPFTSDIWSPLTLSAGMVLGAAGRRGARCPDVSGPCREFPGTLPSAGGCPCGSTPRPL